MIDIDILEITEDEYNALFLIGVRTGLQSILVAKAEIEKDTGKPMTVDQMTKCIQESLTGIERKLWSTKAGREILERHSDVNFDK